MWRCPRKVPESRFIGAKVAEALKKAQMEPLDLVGDEVTALNRKELDMCGKVVRAVNLRPQQ